MGVWQRTEPLIAWYREAGNVVRSIAVLREVGFGTRIVADLAVL